MNGKDKAIDAASQTRCPRDGCKGTLYNVTSRLAQALKVVNLRCDECRGTLAVKIPD